ncbi:hypothetical protein VULLAG_LOCUS3070 [Vulpes lagopus]
MQVLQKPRSDPVQHVWCFTIASAGAVVAVSALGWAAATLLLAGDSLSWPASACPGTAPLLTSWPAAARNVARRRPDGAARSRASLSEGLCRRAGPEQQRPSQRRGHSTQCAPPPKATRVILTRPRTN